MMDGIHDFGGRQGYGPIDVNEAPEPFHSPWEARLFGITRSYTKPARFSIDLFRYVRECIEPSEYLSRGYYDQWLLAHAVIMVDAGAVTVAELASGKSAKAIPNLPPLMTPEKVAPLTKVMSRYERESDADPAFALGDKVKTTSFGSLGHTRLPQFARGREGRIESFHGFHILPDTNMAGDGPAQPLYTVSFLAADLWPEAPGRKDQVNLDLWECYLEPA